ncbi:radical SAM protein [Fusobacterium necrophorum]|uniref:elongator complex protein 3 n=1 Tax=Fusobacterium necrophorum TaxID=859 RepID=UPI00254E3877|nr:radical SAM protein [Fusobacterium necrophorum]MDK4521444.1 radical SAM protein [Fusobacterium necrophorum]
MKHYNIPIFISHFGCPNHCVFCNQQKINGQETDIRVEDIHRIVREYLKTLPKKSEKEVAFFGGTFTGLSMELQREYLETLQEYMERGDIQGIRLSTRPDYIRKEILEQLKKYGVKAIELGIQSLDEEVLRKSDRAYSETEVLESIRQIQNYGFEVGVQLMVGLPASNLEKEIRTVKTLIACRPDTARIYPTLVLADTELEQQYRRGEYQALSLEEAVERSRILYCYLEEAGIRTIRLGLQASEELSQENTMIAGPYHPTFRELVETEISYVFLKRIFEREGVQKVFCSEMEVSRMIGWKKKNKERFGEKFQVSIQKQLLPGEILIAGKRYSREERIRRNLNVGISMDF